MSTTRTDGPVLVLPLEAEHGGVDFLGLRQVSLDLITTCTPPLTNATLHIRPYSLLCWVYWKYHDLKSRTGGTPKLPELQRFREKVELLFTWGHLSANVRGVPGLLSEPPLKGSRAELSFEAWGRQYRNTGLQAPVQYGPSAAGDLGFNFLQPAGEGFFRTVGYGTQLAEALDTKLSKNPEYAYLIDFQKTWGTPQKAEQLFKTWSVAKLYATERSVFREAFYDASTVDEESRRGRRSAAIQLVQTVLGSARKPLPQVDIRRKMAWLSVEADPRRIPVGVLQAAQTWLVLQVRQAQRLAFEAVMAWIEWQIREGNRSAEQIIKMFCTDVEAELGLHADARPEQLTVQWLAGINSLAEYVAAAKKRPQEFCLFRISRELGEIVRGPSKERFPAVCPYALRLLLLSAWLVPRMEMVEHMASHLNDGGRERISLEFWRKRCEILKRQSIAHFAREVVETFVLSQHFAVATYRYDGGTQKLRIAVEEGGLEVLPDKEWRPEVTSDHLQALLSLMCECNLLAEVDDGFQCKRSLDAN